MSDMDRHSATGQHKTAAEYRQTADEHVKTLKDFWKDFLVSGIFILAAIVIIFACLAWFAANNRVSATGSSISAKGEKFYITSAGTTDQGWKTGEYDASSGLVTATSLLVNQNSNLNNYSAKDQIAPGAYGKLEFCVVPTVDDLKSVNVSVDLLPAFRTDGARDNASAEKLLSGHLMLFENRGDDGYYANQIMGNSVTVDLSNAKANKPVKKTIYWVWPSQFQSLVLTGNQNYIGTLFDSTTDGGYATLTNDMTDDPEKYFVGEPSKPADWSQITSTQLESCTSAYDSADELIGNSIKYVHVKLTASEENN